MEPMTIRQFYAVFLVMCVVGVGTCAAMYWLGARCPLLGRKRDTWAEKIRGKLMIAFLFMAAICSMYTLEDVVHAFTNDLTDVATETTMDLGKRAIEGEDISQDLNKLNDIEMPKEGEVIWGEYDKSQESTIYLLTGFWYFLAWMIYLGNFAKSPSSWWQKLCKIIAYPLLTSFILLFPLNVHYINSDELDARVGEENAAKLREDLELVDGVYPEFDVETYRSADVAPVFFGSALNNFGVQELLNCFVEIAPSPRPTKAEERDVEPEEKKFTGFIFKITANIDPNHRSCIAFCKVCSGQFRRNQPYLHVRQGKTMRFSSPTQFMAQRKSTIDEAWPGDIVGLPDTGGVFKIGDTLTEGEQLHFRGLPSFSPELFKYIENDDPMKAKQLQKGIDQLMDEGVAQLFVNQFNNRKIIGTVGQLQFEVIQYRLENEYNAKCRWEPVHLYKACWIESDDDAELENFKKRKYQYMAKDKEGRDVFLADSGYVLSMAQEDFKHIKFHFTSEF